jgi:hypothetical protein
LEQQDAIDAAVWWVLAQPGILLNTVGDLTLLPRVLDAVSRFDAQQSQDALADRVAQLNVEPLFV